MMNWLVAVLVVLGSSFVLLAAIGVVRFPDLYTRMHAATKAGAFGGTVLAIAAAMLFGSWAVWVEVILMVLFFYSTMPIAGHLIALAASHMGIPHSDNTRTAALKIFRNLVERP